MIVSEISFFLVRVNLPRWGLKQFDEIYITNFEKSVNLPRWGLKPTSHSLFAIRKLCKFTPLGFETLQNYYVFPAGSCVNLPRWGLKLELNTHH